MTTQLTGPVQVVGQGFNGDSSNQYHPLGAYCETNDGRGFRYCQVGATALVPGKLYQSSAQDTTNLNPSGGLAVAAAAIGATTVTLTGSLTLAYNLLANGYMVTDVTPGQGYTLRVKGNTAVSSAANCVVTLEDPLIVALTTSSKVVFSQNAYSNVIVNPTTASGCPVGVATYVVSATNYGWLQTHGTCGVLNDSGTAIGLGLAPSAATAGALKTAASTLNTVGFSQNVGVTTEYNFVFLTID
jgi:hypothetical protein